MKLKPGDTFPVKTLESATGEPIKIPDRLRRRAGEMEAAAVKEVIAFHSSAESIRS